uniref:Uncharacterized protein n=1 Tax=Romanomermis culicivorax TaxID=13658 RepID=A0A915IAJ6_ROMCU
MRMNERQSFLMINTKADKQDNPKMKMMNNNTPKVALLLKGRRRAPASFNLLSINASYRVNKK